MPTDSIRYEVRGQSAWITLSRPEKHNALDSAAWTALREAIDRAGDDGDVRAIVLIGDGTRAFSTGADLAELAQREALDAYANARRLQGIAAQVGATGKPSIAALRGWAVGGGFELALGCTFRVAARSARVGLPEVDVATLAGAGGTQRVTRLAPRGVALRMLLLGEMLSAEDAHAAGLVDRVVDDDALLDSVSELVDQLTAREPEALALILESVRLADETTLSGGLAAEAALFGLTIAAGGHREKIARFQGAER